MNPVIKDTYTVTVTVTELDGMLFHISLTLFHMPQVGLDCWKMFQARGALVAVSHFPHFQLFFSFQWYFTLTHPSSAAPVAFLLATIHLWCTVVSGKGELRGRVSEWRLKVPQLSTDESKLLVCIVVAKRVI